VFACTFVHKGACAPAFVCVFLCVRMRACVRGRGGGLSIRDGVFACFEFIIREWFSKIENTPNDLIKRLLVRGRGRRQLTPTYPP